MRIALIGPTGSGKSTTARLVEEHVAASGRTFARVKLAEPLYELQQRVYAAAGVPIDHYAQDQVLLELLAAQLRRINPAGIADAFLSRLDAVTADVVVNDDLRDPFVDAVRLREAGFVIVRVRCPEEVRLGRLSGRGDVTVVRHSATTRDIDLIDTDAEIVNAGTVAELRQAVTQMLGAVSDTHRS